MTKRRFAWVLAVLAGAMPLVTTATCDPVTGAFDFFRDDDFGDYYDDYYYDDYYYEDYYYDCYYCY